MLRCYAENVVAHLDVSLSVSLQDVAVTGTAPAAASSVEQPPATATATDRPASKVFDVVMQLCHLRLLRDLAFKGQVFSPFIPTKQVLFLFPCSIEPTTRAGLAEGASNKMALFLSLLYQATGGVVFRIAGALLCVDSGNAALVLECDTINDALQLQDVCDDVDRQGPQMRMSAMYIQSFACQYIPGSEGITDAQRVESLRELYYIPSCPLCAERLEPSFTEAYVAGERPVCACCCASGGGGGAVSLHRSCTCLQKSACIVCQQLLCAQLTSSGGSGGSQPQVKCQECRQSGDPWICMICGYVGCSRYQAMHAKEHSVRCGHFFSINLLTQQIWDYHSDAFVHHVMFLVDATSGKTTRLQYPGHEDAATAALLSSNEDNEGVDDDHGSNSGDPRHRSGPRAPKQTHVDPVTEKKVVSGKYDAKLSTSHTQYATVLKNELDGMRAIHSENAWMTVRGADPETILTKAVVAQLLEHASITLPCEGADSENRDGQEDSDEEASREGPSRTPREAAARGAHNVLPSRNTDNARSLSAGGKEMDPYGALFTSLEPLCAILAANHQEQQSIAYGIQHLTHELGIREQECMPLEQTANSLEVDLRAVVRRNVMDSLELDHAIEELQSTLREIDLNVSTQRQLMSMMGSTDSAARMVVMGEGRSAEKKGGPGGGGKPKSVKR